MTRSLDIAAALLLGIFALPIVALAALAVLADIGRPVFFVQARSGLGGRCFPMAKLRSMTDARGTDGRLLPDGQRLTRLGRFLRRSRIDELPGLWHVLTGDMSLVGPRPLLPETITRLGAGGEQRGAVRPGLTGWSQVNGNALLDDETKLSLDLWYIDHASLRLDLAILLKTLRVVLLGERVGTPMLGGTYAGRHRRGR